MDMLPKKQPLGRSFMMAFAGVWGVARSERNFQIHLGVAVVVIALAAWLHVDREGWGILVLTIALVLSLEGMNSAIEAVVDIASPGIHPLAKHAKDAAAGAVLIAALGAVVVGLIVLLPLLLARLGITLQI